MEGNREPAMSHLTLLLVAEIAWVCGLSAWIIMERRSPQATLAWVFALAWLPYLGILVYLLVGPRRLTRKRRRYAMARSRVAQASSHYFGRAEPAPVGQWPDWPLAQFARLADRLDHSPPVRAERIELLHGGDACYASLEQAIREARHHVHLEYYIWRPDQTGRRFQKLLCEAARRRVEVRLLVDAIGSSSLGRRFMRPLVEAGVEVARFNPLSLGRLRAGLMNFRTHRKIVVCDGRVGFTGGMNICDLQSAAASGERAWRDTHLRIEGPPVAWLQRGFLQDWFFATGGGPTHASYFACDDGAQRGPWVQIVASGPDEDRYAIQKLYFAAVASAQRRVLVTTPYFVPDEPLLAALVSAALRGVDVRVLLPQRSDSLLVTAAARSYFDELVRANVAIFEYAPNMLHAKTLVADDAAIVGTANMDNRSFRLNFEVVAAVYDAATADALAASFAEDLCRATRYTMRRARQTPLPQRMIQSAARLLSPIL